MFGAQENVYTDRMLEKHITSYMISQRDAMNNFDEYQNQRSTLDADGLLSEARQKLIHLQDSVAFKFTLPSTQDSLYFSFLTNFDLNPKGIMVVEFETTKPIVIYVSSEVKRPTEATAQKVLHASGLYDPTSDRTTPVDFSDG